MIIIRNKNNNVINVIRKEVVVESYHGRTFKTLRINDEFNLKLRDKIKYICFDCGHEKIEAYHSNTKFNNKNILCRECSKKQTFLRKYGVENPYQSEIIKNKIKNTNIERYGNENYRNVNKAKQTCLNNYGVENISQLNEIKKTKEKDDIRKIWERKL